MRTHSGSVARTVAAVVAALVVAAQAWAGPSLKSWRDGPVASLLSEDEYRRFGDLPTDDVRREFIEAFWRGSEAYRETFQDRCSAIDDRFRTALGPGWRTDQGRVFLALGEPTSIRREPGSVSAVDREIWSYGGSTGGSTEVGARIRVVFYRCRDGRYRLDPSCAIERDPTSVAYDAYRADFVRRVRDENPGIAGGGLATMLNGLLLPVPGGVALPAQPTARLAPARTVPAAAPSDGAASNLHALENSAYFFRAQDGSVLTLLTVALLADRGGAGDGVAEGDAAPGFAGAASIEETGRRGEDLPNTSAREIELDQVPGTPAEGRAAAFFGRVYLQPGRTYAVRYAVKDDARDQVFVKNDLVGVPTLGRGFSVSSVVPAEEYGPAAAGKDRFQVGSEEVVPRAGGVFRRSELLRLYLQVYDAALHPETSMPRVDVVFRFYRLIKGVSKRVGKPFSVRGAAGASMGLALPIGDWPTGPYRVVVELHDRVSEARATAEGSFAIVDE